MASQDQEKKHPLGNVLSEYIRPLRWSYDMKFDTMIRKVAPHWFVNGATINKEELIRMARVGELKPTKKHKLYGVFNNYICKRSRSYDGDFDAEIRKIAPRWFIDAAALNKVKLLEMARNGEPRPSKGKHSLGKVLIHYTSKKSTCYDVEFDAEIRKTAPHWFVDTVIENKAKLLEMARNGELKINRKKHSLGSPLNDYTCKSSKTYDANFDTEIRKLAPHWFKRKITHV